MVSKSKIIGDGIAGDWEEVMVRFILAILLGILVLAFTTNAFATNFPDGDGAGVKYTLTKSDDSKIVISTAHNNPDHSWICSVNKNGNASSYLFMGTVAQALADWRSGHSVKLGGSWPC